MSQSYMSQTNHLWDEIYQIVKDNCPSEYKGESPQDNIMRDSYGGEAVGIRCKIKPHRGLIRLAAGVLFF